MSTCPPRDEWLRHLDGEVTANRAAELALHAEACGSCGKQTVALDGILRALKAPSVTTGPATVARVMAHLDDAPAKPARAWWPRFLVGGMAFAAAAAVLLLVVRARPSEDEFTARGAKSTPVAVAIHALGSELTRLEPGAQVTPQTAYVASYRNTGGAAFVMVFAIDSARELHWLYPAFTDAATDPASVEVAATLAARLFEETVILDAPARGAMQLVVLVSSQPLRVSVLERLPRDQRTLDAIRARWPAAELTVTPVDVR